MTTPDTIATLVKSLAQRARQASLSLATLSESRKNAFLHALAEMIEAHADDLREANQKDLDAGAQAGLSGALLDRLKLTPERIAGMAEGVRQVAALPDPVGEELEQTVRPNGIDIRKIRVPIGVIAIIYESRPNVTIDCAALCLKSGNAAILRGGKEAFHSNTALANLITRTLEAQKIDAGAIQLIPVTEREAMNHLLRLSDLVHCVIPRGGEALIRYVTENSTVPVIKHFKGVCNVYVDKAADPDMAESIVINAKCQRPGVCNAAENLFMHRDCAPALLPRLGQALAAQGVELRADPEALALLKAAGLEAKAATEADFHEEYLDLILAIKVVDSLEDAITAVNTYGSGHSDAIVTTAEDAARRFLAGVDSATVYWNASTRFTDGYEFGLGAEIGISTDRLHARGPMGLRELCTYKFVIHGTGQIR